MDLAPPIDLRRDNPRALPPNLVAPCESLAPAGPTAATTPDIRVHLLAPDEDRWWAAGAAVAASAKDMAYVRACGGLEC